ncbi:MAG: hypothetical protein HGA85_02055 [Nanoarchaeota archaeon]|nr:hypothetical protein [Nanoarchaeota archaeon]
MDLYEPKLFAAYLVDLSPLDVKDPDAKPFINLAFGPEHPIGTLPEIQNYGMLKTIWDQAIEDQYSVRKVMQHVWELQKQEKLMPGTLMLYKSDEGLYCPYSENPGLNGLELPYPMPLGTSIVPEEHESYIHIFPLSTRYIPPEADFLDLAEKTDLMAKKLRFKEKYHEEVTPPRLWLTDMNAFQVEQSLIFLRQAFGYIPPLNQLD